MNGSHPPLANTKDQIAADNVTGYLEPAYKNDIFREGGHEYLLNCSLLQIDS